MRSMCVRAGHTARGTVTSPVFSLHADLSVCMCVGICVFSFVFICGHCLIILHPHEQAYKLSSHYSLGAVLHNVKFINRVIRHLAV